MNHILGLVFLLVSVNAWWVNKNNSKPLEHDVIVLKNNKYLLYNCSTTTSSPCKTWRSLTVLNYNRQLKTVWVAHLQDIQEGFKSDGTYKMVTENIVLAPRIKTPRRGFFTNVVAEFFNVTTTWVVFYPFNFTGIECLINETSRICIGGVALRRKKHCKNVIIGNQIVLLVSCLGMYNTMISSYGMPVEIYVLIGAFTTTIIIVFVIYIRMLKIAQNDS